MGLFILPDSSEILPLAAVSTQTCVRLADPITNRRKH